MKNRGYKIILRCLCMLLLVLSIGWGSAATAKAVEDGNQIRTNFSTTYVTSRYGCEAHAVYQYCKFYANFWAPSGNQYIQSATVTIKKKGTTVASNTVLSSVSSEYTYVSVPFTINEAGTYTAERSITTLSGSTVSFKTYTLVVNKVADCGTVLSASPSSVALSSVGSSYDITAKVSGIIPDVATMTYSYTSSNISCSWNGGWFDSDGNGTYDSTKLTVRGIAEGIATVTISYKELNTGTVIAKKTINVTVGPYYIVSYRANGGSQAPAMQAKYHGKTLKLRSSKPIRTGYTFLGWSTKSTATSPTYKAGGSYTGNRSVVLYAVWERNKYPITYKANGGSGAPAAQTKYYGQSLKLRATKPTRTGYTFLGWSTSSTATSPTYKAGESYTRNQKATLYAVWKKSGIDVSSVTLDKNSLTLLIGKSAVLKATVSPGNATVKTIKWSTGNSKVATVESDGTVKGIAKGTTTITAKSNNGKIASCKVTVKVPLSKLEISVKNATYTGKQVKPAVTVRYGSSVLKNGTDYTLSYGKNVAAGTGTVKVAGKGYYTGTVQKNFTIAKRTQSITASSVTKIYGSRNFSLNAKAAGNGKLTYSVSDSKVAVVSAGGTVSIKGYGKTNVTISAAATSNYNAARKTITITVKPRKVSWDSVFSPEKGKIYAIWKADTRANGYIYSVSQNASFSSGATKTDICSKDVTGKKFSGKMFESGKVYYIRVRAYKTVGNEKILGDWSNTVSIKVK